MKNFLIITLFFSISMLYSQDCEKYKTSIDSLMKEFNSVKEKMSKQDISREEYNDLYAIYTMEWEEIVDMKKAYNDCNESKKVVVKKVVEPRKVDYDMPRILDIKWGSDRNTVKDLLRKKTEIKLNDTDQSLLEYRGGKYMDYPVEKWQFNFSGGKLYACQIILKVNAKENSLKQYGKLTKKLEDKHGEPSYDKNTIPDSYKTDDLKLSSLKNKTSSLYKKWLFKNGDMLRVKIGTDGKVLVTCIYDKIYSKMN